MNNNLVMLIVSGAVAIVLCLFVYIVSYNRFSKAFFNVRQRVDMLEKEFGLDIEKVQKSELMLTESGRELLKILSEEEENARKQEKESRKIKIFAEPEYYSLSVEMPDVLPKQLESLFHVNIDFPNYNGGKLLTGKKLKISLISPDIDFSSPIIKQIASPTRFLFLGKPKYDCQIGIHRILLKVSDGVTDEEYGSAILEVKIVDYVFANISRPLFSQISSAVLGLGAFALFALTIVGQIHATVGLVSAFSIGSLASLIYAKRNPRRKTP